MITSVAGWLTGSRRWRCSAASSSSLSIRSAALAESVIDCGRRAPGIGMTCSPSDSSQASTTCCGLTPCSAAISPNAANRSPTSRAAAAGAAQRAPGQEGDAALAAVLQLVLAAPELRRELVLHADQPVRRRARRSAIWISSTLALEMPMALILPSSWRVLKLAIASA